MKNRTLFLLTNLLLYFFAGISVFYFVMVLFTDAINNFRMFLDYLPLYLTLIVPVYGLIAVNRISKVKSDNLKLRKIKVQSLVLMSISFVAFVYGFINTFVSFAGNFLAGGPSKYFPLSFLLLDVGFVAIFAYILFVFRNEKAVAESKPKSSVGKVILDVLKHLHLLFALYFLGTFAFGFYSFDLSLKHVLGTLPVYLLMVVPSAVIIVLEIVKGKDLKEKLPQTRFIIGLVSLGVAAALGAWTFIYLAAEPNFLVDALTASFPLDFAISLNLAPILLVIVGALPALYIVISHLLLTYGPALKSRFAKK